MGNPFRKKGLRRSTLLEVSESIAEDAARKAWRPLDARLWQIEQDIQSIRVSLGAVQQTATNMHDSAVRRIDTEVREIVKRCDQTEVDNKNRVRELHTFILDHYVPYKPTEDE